MKRDLRAGNWQDGQQILAVFKPLQRSWCSAISSTTVYTGLDYDFTERFAYHIRLRTDIPPRCEHKLSSKHLAHGCQSED